jgi:hypothetical protein
VRHSSIDILLLTKKIVATATKKASSFVEELQNLRVCVRKSIKPLVLETFCNEFVDPSCSMQFDVTSIECTFSPQAFTLPNLVVMLAAKEFSSEKIANDLDKLTPSQPNPKDINNLAASKCKKHDVHPFCCKNPVHKAWMKTVKFSGNDDGFADCAMNTICKLHIDRSKRLYVPLMNYDSKVLEDKKHAFLRLVQVLGVKEISIQDSKDGTSGNEIGAGVGNGLLSAKASCSSQEAFSAFIAQSYPDQKRTAASLKAAFKEAGIEDNFFFKQEPSWENLAKGRLESALQTQCCEFSYQSFQQSAMNMVVGLDKVPGLGLLGLSGNAGASTAQTVKYNLTVVFHPFPVVDFFLRETLPIL